jgi:hypothetical protein
MVEALQTGIQHVRPKTTTIASLHGFGSSTDMRLHRFGGANDTWFHGFGSSTDMRLHRFGGANDTWFQGFGSLNDTCAISMYSDTAMKMP